MTGKMMESRVTNCSQSDDEENGQSRDALCTYLGRVRLKALSQ